MKKVFAIANVVFAFACAASEMITGPYNTTLGYLAGYDASGEKITAMGAAAGGDSWGNSATAFFGAASGVGSYYLDNCLGIGYRALRESHHMTNVVAIGSNALAGRDNIRDATWINGHFYAENGRGLFLCESNRQEPGAASLTISNGVAVLRGDLVVTGDVWRNADGAIPAQVAAREFDYYVSQIGDDALNGTQPAPCRTLSGVLARIRADIDDGKVEEKFFTIGVTRGEYEFPGDIPAFGAEFVAVDGKAKTFIKPLSEESPRRITKPNAGVSYLTSFTGFTIEGFNCDMRFSRGSSAGVWFKRSAFYLCAFEGCTFRDADMPAMITKPDETSWDYTFIFNSCLLDGCEVEPSVIPLPLSKANFYGNNPGIDDAIFRCECYGSVIRLGQHDISRDLAKPFASYTLFDNCFIEVPRTGGYYFMRGGSAYKTVYGTIPEVSNCTIAIGEIRTGTFAHMNTAFYNSLFTVGSGLPAWNDTMTGKGNRNAPGMSYGADFRPTDYAARFYGFASEGDRGLKNSIVGAVVDALNDEGQQAVAARMMLKMQPPVDPKPAPPTGERPPDSLATERPSPGDYGGDEANPAE